MSSRGDLDWKFDFTKGSWCILPLRQCLQCEVTEEVHLNTSECSSTEIAECETLSVGWPSLWCHRKHLFDLLMLKAECGVYYAEMD